MPIWLSFLVCVSGSTICHVEVPDIDPFMGLPACQVAGMQSWSQWERNHPGFYIAKVRCSIGSRPQGDDQA